MNPPAPAPGTADPDNQEFILRAAARPATVPPKIGGNAMYPGVQVKVRPDQAAVVMATSGETITYAELEARTNRLAHLFRRQGLARLDHYAIFMENHPRY